MAPPARILLVRHAHHDSGGRFTQHSCLGLSEFGRQQAKRLADRLAADDLGPDPLVLSSRARRCSETAEIVASALGVGVEAATCELCEMHPGRAEGLTSEEMCEQFGTPSWAGPRRRVLSRLAARGGRASAVPRVEVRRADGHRRPTPRGDEDSIRRLFGTVATPSPSSDSTTSRISRPASITRTVPCRTGNACSTSPETDPAVACRWTPLYPFVASKWNRLQPGESPPCLS